MRPLIPVSHLTDSPNPERQFRFMEIVRRKLRERRYRRRTEEAYLYWIRRYIGYNERRHPRDLGEADVQRFLSALAVEQGVAASTQNQALAALTFLYDRVLERPLTRFEGMTPARRSRYVPVVLSEDELRAILKRLKAPTRLCAMLMYGSGLRLLECMQLRVKDIDVDRREIVIRSGKGGSPNAAGRGLCGRDHSSAQGASHGATLFIRPESLNARPVIPCDIHLRHIYSRQVRIFGPCRSCSATRTFGRR